MDVIERINSIITAEGLNVASFARIVGIGDQTIRGIVVQKRNKPGFEVLSRILETFLDVNAEWLPPLQSYSIISGKKMKESNSLSKRISG